jgi:hypothetical protein
LQISTEILMLTMQSFFLVDFGELGALLATALQRLQARQSSGESLDVGESSLHILLHQSGDAAEWQSGEQG